MLIINEREFVEYVLVSKDLGSEPAATLFRVQKYYASLGFNRSEVSRKTSELIRMSAPMDMERLEAIAADMIKNAMHEPLVELGFIPITVSEMDKIEVLKSLPLRKLAFTLLVLSKYHTAVRPESSGWITESDAQLFAMANVNAPRDKHGLMLNDIAQAGLISFANTVDSASVRVLFATPGTEAMRITDMRNLGYQYARYIGVGRYKPCATCGLLVPATSSKWQTQIRCPRHADMQAKAHPVVCEACGSVFIAPSKSKTTLCPACYDKHRRGVVKRSVARGRGVTRRPKEDTLLAM